MKNNTFITLLTMVFLAFATTLFAGGKEKELYEGITKGDLARVKKAVEAGADLNKPVSLKLPLVWALETSHQVDIIRYLIEKGANVNATDIKGSVLMQYAHFVQTPKEKAEWLTDFYKKYKVDSIVDPAIYSSITDVVNVLLDANADPMYDMGTIIGNPMQAGMVFGSGSDEAKAEFIKALSLHPTNHADPNDRMRTAESVSQNSQGFKLVDKEKHPTPLMYAAQKGWTKVAIAFIEGGADVNLTMNVYKSSSDMWAIYNTRTTVTALDIARNTGNKELEAALLKAGAN